MYHKNKSTNIVQCKDKSIICPGDLLDQIVCNQLDIYDKIRVNGTLVRGIEYSQKLSDALYIVMCVSVVFVVVSFGLWQLAEMLY